MDQTYITLNNGAKIPQFGMGVYMVPEGEESGAWAGKGEASRKKDG